MCPVRNGVPQQLRESVIELLEGERTRVRPVGVFVRVVMTSDSSSVASPSLTMAI